MRTNLLLLAMVSFLLCTAVSQDIEGLYSSIDSFDVTVSGDVNGSILQMEILSGGKAIQSREIVLDGPGTWVGLWDKVRAKEGSYDVCATIWSGEQRMAQRCFNFYHAALIPVRFDVRDFRVDSKGIQLSIYSQDPTIVDLEYMLISGEKVLYTTRDEAVAIVGGAGGPIQMNSEWKQILNSGQRYSGRVKVTESSHNLTRAFMSSFIAKEDGRITETYEDETGASATIIGSSRVPFEGRLEFTLSKNGSIISSIEKKTPVLLLGDDETVEISWNQTLEPGIYKLKVTLMDGGGRVVDLKESVIEAKPSNRPAIPQEPPKESPMVPAAISILSILAAGCIILKARAPPPCKRDDDF